MKVIAQVCPSSLSNTNLLITLLRETLSTKDLPFSPTEPPRTRYEEGAEPSESKCMPGATQAILEALPLAITSDCIGKIWQ